MSGARSSHWPWNALAPPMPTGPTMSGPLPEAISVASASLAPAYGTRLEGQVDVRVAGVELLDDLLLDVDLLRRVAGAEAAVPADLGLAGRGRRPVDRRSACSPGPTRSRPARRRPRMPRPTGRRTPRSTGPWWPSRRRTRRRPAPARRWRRWLESLACAPPRGLGAAEPRRNPVRLVWWPRTRRSVAPSSDSCGSGAGAHDDALDVVAGAVAADVGPAELDRPSRPVEGDALDEQRRAMRRDARAGWASRGGRQTGSSVSRARPTRVS